MLVSGGSRPLQAQFDEWEKVGAVTVRYAFSASAAGGDALSKRCKYVQHRLWVHREEVRQLWNIGAKVFFCGSGKMSKGVEEYLVRIYREGKGGGVSEEEAREWLKGVRNERFASDVFD